MPDPVLRFDARFTVASEVGYGGEPCWLWRGGLNRGGYAQFQVGGRGSPQPLAHRWNYERHVAPIPDGWQVDHLCKVRHCVNPAHLEAVPHAVNNARSDSPSALNARMVLCKRGLHELAGDNLVACFKARGVRRCRACYNAYQRERRTRKTWTKSGVAA